MADHEQTIRAALIGHSGTSTYVGERVWYGELPQQEKDVAYVPALVIQSEPLESEYAMGGPIGLAFRKRVQLDSLGERIARPAGSCRDEAAEALGNYEGD